MKTAKSWASTSRDFNESSYSSKKKSKTLSTPSYASDAKSYRIISVETKPSHVSKTIESILAESKDSNNANENCNEFIRNSLRDSLGNNTSEILFKAMKDIKYKKADSKNSEGPLSARYESKGDNNDKSKHKQYSSDDIDALLMDAAQKELDKDFSKLHKKDKLTKLKEEKMRLARLSAKTYEVSEKDKKKDRTLKYSLYDEARNCTFKPRIHGKKKSETVDPDVKQAGGNLFFDRQEAALRKSRDELDKKTGEKEYAKLLDKKYCPQCCAAQSYDEFKNKKNQCQNCRIDYRRKIVWGQIQNKFFEKGKEYAQQELANKKEILKNIKREELEKRMKELNIENIEDVQKKLKPLKWSEVEEEFIGRLVFGKEEIKNEYDRKIKEIKQKKEHKDFFDNLTFKPIRSRNKTTNEEGEEILEANPKAVVEAFLQREEEYEQERRAKFPYKFKEKKTLDVKAFKP